jgi:uncharacterized protein YkwD
MKQPSATRARLAGFLTAGGTLLGGAAIDAEAAQADPAAPRDTVDKSLFQEINNVRGQHGVAPVRYSAGLDRAATERSTDMARRGYFGHTLPGGQWFARVVSQSYPTTGFRSWKVGENLLWSAPARSSIFIVRAWLRSPKHRRVLLSPSWREGGIGAVRVRSAPGVYGNRAVTIVTAEFGVRRR